VAHVFASNAASNKEHASNRESAGSGVAVNGQAERMPESSGCAVRSDASLDDVRRGGAVAPARKQRWSREAYNAYQREYMRKKRESNPG